MTSSLPRAGPFPPWKLLKTSFAKCQHTTPSQSVGRHCALKDLSIHEPKEVDVAFRVLSMTPDKVRVLSSAFEQQVSQRSSDTRLTHFEWLLTVSSILERYPSKFETQGHNGKQSSSWQHLFDESSRRPYSWNLVTKQTRWSLDIPQLSASKDANPEGFGSEGMAEALIDHGREFPVTGPSGPSVSEAALSHHTPHMELTQAPVTRRPPPEVLDSGVTSLTADLRNPDRTMTQTDPSLHPSETADNSPVHEEPPSPRVCIMAQTILRDWIRDADTELGEILSAIRRHAKRIHSFALAMKARFSHHVDRDKDFRDVFALFQNVGELRAAIGRASKGKTGRLTTIDDLASLTDEHLAPVLLVCNLGFAGELPPCLKLGDVVPLLKDWYRIRPITCLYPIFKIVDGEINSRFMRVLCKYNMLPPGTFGFVPDGAPDWAIETAATVQWLSRRQCMTDYQYFLDATSAYDTLSHSAVSMACHIYAIPRDVEDMLLATISGHERLCNTAYQVGYNDTRAKLHGGVAQGAPSSPTFFTFTNGFAAEYSNSLAPTGFPLLPRPSSISHQVPPKRAFEAAAIEPNVKRIKLQGYADDLASQVGGYATTTDEAKKLFDELNNSADGLTVMLALNGIRLNLGKSYFQYSLQAGLLMDYPPVLSLTALDHRGVFLRKPLTVATIPGDITATSDAGKGVVRYL
jgi:hypothetical protein